MPNKPVLKAVDLSKGPYRAWLEQTATTTLVVYSALVVVLLPAFHYVLGVLPGAPPDSLGLRLLAAGISAAVALLVLLWPAARRYSPELQLVNMLPTVVVVPLLVVQSGNNPFYVASSLLVCVGVQQAFYRYGDIVECALIGVAAQIGFSAAAGILFDPRNVAVVATIATGYLIACTLAILRIRIQHNEVASRFAAQEMEGRLDRLAHVDTLTELPNRATLLDHVDRALVANEGQRIAVIFLDLDRFKDVNDTLGHPTGDVLLHSVAKRFSSLVPPNGMLARWGGDEFVVVLGPIADQSTASELAETLIRSTHDPFVFDDYEFVVTASAGIAVAPQHGCDASTLIRNADTAMYRAKETEGRGYAFFEPGLHTAAMLRQRIRNELRKAPENGTLELHYQPIMETATTRIVGAEALLRWRQPDGELLMPDDFVPIAEESGLIVPIGSWVLEHACKQIQAWQEAGRPLKVAVNVSARQLANPDFLDVLRVVLKQTQIDPSLLEIEITETTLMSYVDEILSVLHAIKTLGVGITIDDFGTGYSSFAYLKRFPLDSLKLDRTFVTGIDHREDRAIVASLITIAQALGMKVTAEGVESRVQLEILADSRCDQIQGFFVSRPLPVEAFEQRHSWETV